MCSFHHPILRLSNSRKPNPNFLFSLCFSSYALGFPEEICTPLPVCNRTRLESYRELTQVFITHLQNCTELPELHQIHAKLIRTHLLENHPTPLFWNSIIRAYLRFGHPLKSFFIYLRMMRAGTLPDSYTIPILLKAMCQIFAVGEGRQLHSQTVKLGLESNEFCESGLISLYAKSGDLEGARLVFDKNPQRKLGSWNSLIAGFAQGGRSKEALAVFLDLMRSTLEPDDVTMVSVVSACGALGDLNLALQVHKCVLDAQNFGKSDILVSNSVIDMYGKCGRVDLAYEVFKRMTNMNVSTWSSMIMGLAMHGHEAKALDYFHCMRNAGVRPNHVTFVGVLSACAHAGLVEEGMHYFDMMMDVYGIMPMVQHYGCMVDLLGRAGLLNEAREMIEKMPMKANAVIWGTLLGACEKHRGVEMGEWVARNLVELEPFNDGVYVVLSNIYASVGMWEEVERVRRVMREMRLSKTPGYSLTTISS